MPIDLVFQQCDEKSGEVLPVETVESDGSNSHKMEGLSSSIMWLLDCVTELDRHYGLRIGLSIL